MKRNEGNQVDVPIELLLPVVRGGGIKRKRRPNDPSALKQWSSKLHRKRRRLGRAQDILVKALVALALQVIISRQSRQAPLHRSITMQYAFIKKLTL